MKYGLNDDVVRRIAAIAFHSDDKMMDGLSDIYNNINDPAVHMNISNAHMTDALNGRFKDKEEENIFKEYIAKASAMNRGTLAPVIKVKKSAKSEA